MGNQQGFCVQGVAIKRVGIREKSFFFFHSQDELDKGVDAIEDKHLLFRDVVSPVI